VQTIVTHVRIRVGKEDAWDEAFRERVAAARGQSGFVAVQLCMPEGKANERVVIGTWRSRDDWAAWHDTPEFRRTRHELEEADPERESEWWHDVLLEERSGPG
jgi:heme-degrading monooxygenase HmoA